MNFGVLLFIAAILTVVMIHEAGHFIVAKHYGFKATQFFIGFGPTLWSTRRGETEYGVKALPLGGFVKILGMNPYEEIAPEDRSRAYSSKPAWQRALVLVAGSATHWVVAFVLLVVTTMTIGFPTGDATNRVAAVETLVGGGQTPALEAGLRPGDVIVGVGGDATNTWGEIRSYIRGRGGKPAEFTIERDGATRTLEATLGRAVFASSGRLRSYVGPGEPLPERRPGDEVVGFLGVQPQPEFQTQGFPGAVVEAGERTWEVTMLSVRGIGDVFGMVFGGELWDAVTGNGTRAVDEGPLGLVGAGRIAGETVATGNYLQFIGLIVGFTIFVGLMNLLPLPPLDGGHLAVVAYEAISGKAVDLRRLIPVAAAVISFFVVLFLAVLYLDLARPIRVPF
ncbi:MAG: site-2 protease family protein [Actinobacteria bacterium]|nr:site-2 protease family protein [Actinomycetota bacterium]